MKLCPMNPLDDRVVIKPMVAKEKSRGGILLPDTAQQKPHQGTVVAVGPGRMLDDNTRARMSVKTGDEVLYPLYGGVEIKMGDKEYVVLHESDILGIVEGKKG